MLEKQQQIKIIGTKIDYLGQGVARHNNQVVFIPGLIDDEEAIVEITNVKKSFAVAKIIEILKPSSDRKAINPLHLTSLDLAHLSIEKQLKWQVDTTIETFDKIAGLDQRVEPIIFDGHSEYYRNKAVFRVDTEPYLQLLMFSNNNQNRIPVDHFILANRKINEALEIIAKAKIKVEDKYLNAIAFRSNDQDQLLVTLIAKKNESKGLSELVNVIKKIKGVVGITLNVQDDPRHILGKKSFLLYGVNELLQTNNNNLRIIINDRSFFQVNSLINRAYDLIAEDLESNSTIIDAYSGVGSIGFSLIEKAKKVHLVDTNFENIKNARITIKENNLSDVSALCMDANEAIKKLEADALIVDPPRQGLNNATINAILERDFKKIYYLSCDLKTLVRDLNLLSTQYEIKKVHPIRMFMHTTETETLVILKNKK
ncbi:MAG: 23S rRNA (uracil(1939)-C(5))-methyltransferase RlmD [Acholeplasmataceae bacterium]